MANLAVDLLLKQIKGADSADEEKVYRLQASLNERESC